MIIHLIAFVFAIVLGIVAVINLVADVELLVNILSFTFGITAVIWVFRARKSLSKGSSLKTLTTHFIFILVFLLGFSLWNMLVSLFALGDYYGRLIVFGEYFFITLAYIAFVGTAFHIRNMGKEFGFEGESKKIAQLIKKKKQNKK